MIIFDIETESLPFDKIEHLMPPFDPASVKCLVEGEFDPSTVKLGTMKDEAKIKAKVDAARAAFAEAKACGPALIEESRIQHIAEFLDRAALSAVTGRVLVVGYYSVEKDKVVIDDGGKDGDESKIIVNFWKQYALGRAAPRKLVGLNIFDFDLPFLIRRSWILGIDVPATAVKDDRYFDQVFIDLRRRWLCGQHFSACESNFDVIGKALGTGGKNGQSGADFARLWKEDRAAAINYLTNDLKQPAAWAARMGLI